MKEFKGKLLLFKKLSKSKNKSQNPDFAISSDKISIQLRIAKIMHKIDKLGVIINGISKV
jgi:hypothetical protein